MSNTAPGRASDLVALEKLARQWESEVQKDCDVLAGVLDKVDRGDPISKEAMRRARSALKRLKR